MVPEAKPRGTEMTNINITAVNVANSRRTVLASAAGELDLTPVEIAEAIYGMVECHPRKDGSRYWYGRRNVWGFREQDAQMLKDFFEVNGLEALADAMVPISKAGNFNSKSRQIMYYVEYSNR